MSGETCHVMLEWAPDIPPTWDVVNLKMLARIFAGGTPDRKNADYWSDGAIPWLNSGSVNDWAISTPSELIALEALANGATRLAPKGSVLVALAGQGKTKGMAARLEIDSTLNQSLAAIVPGASLDYRFLQYWLASNYLNIRGLAGGDLRDGLNLQHIGSIQVPRPLVEEQRAIADYLDRETAQIDAFIAKNEELIALLTERRGALRAELATGGRSPEPRKATGLFWAPEVPSTWEVVRLTSVAELESGHTPSRSVAEYWRENECVIPWISLNDVGHMASAEYLENTTNQISEAGLAGSSARILPAGTVVLSRDATIGRSSIMAVPMATSQHFADWVCGDKLMPRYLWLLFTSCMQGLFDSLTNGSTIRTIGVPDLKSFRIPLPPLANQARIVESALAADQQFKAVIETAARAGSLARERRAALITAAVTGKIDVGAAA